MPIFQKEVINTDKPKLHIVSLSGGKDSTAMLLRMLEEGMQVDEILFCDTGLEFEGMYHHIDKLEKYIGRPITRLKSEKDFEYLFLEHEPKRKNPELIGRKGYSWAGPRNRWCTAILKQRVIDRYLRERSKEYELVQYIGIAADEPQRIHEFNYPLVEWGMTEADCLAYCKERGFDWDGLYDIFHRVSCWCCPLQSLEELRKLRKHFPELWEQLRDWDRRTWRTFLKNYSVEQLETRFALEDERLAAGLPIKGKAFFDVLHAFPSHAQTIRMRKAFEQGKLSYEMVKEIMNEEKPNQKPKYKFSYEKLSTYIQKDLHNSQIEEFVIEALKYYTSRRRKGKQGNPSGKDCTAAS